MLRWTPQSVKQVNQISPARRGVSQARAPVLLVLAGVEPREQSRWQQIIPT
jgi:hypothetical protein